MSYPRRSTRSRLTASTLLTVLLILNSSLPIAFAQADDVARRTRAFTFPLDETVIVDFAGSTRFPRTKGIAKVTRTIKGTNIDFAVAKMPRPIDVGAGYATYVLWAVSPEGQVDNLGEIPRNGDGEFDSSLQVTTPLTTFALLITAEPHLLVTRPSSAVVLENSVVRFGRGKIVAIDKSVQYFGNSSDFFRDPRTPEINATEYSSMPSTLLQAKQAVALARYSGAERDAPAEMGEASTKLAAAESNWLKSKNAKLTDPMALEALRTAVKAEGMSLVRKEARERRNEQTRTDVELRARENRAKEAEEELQRLREEMARATRERELAERDAANLQAELKRLKSEKEAATKAAEALQRELEQREAAAKARLSDLHNLRETRDPTFSDPATVRLARYPTVESKTEVKKKETFTVQVSLTERKITADVIVGTTGKDASKETDGKIGITLKPNTANQWDIDVVLSAASGDFVLTGPDTMPITLPRDGDSTPARFSLTAKEFPEAERHSRIMVSFYSGGSFLARVEKEVVIKSVLPTVDGENRERQKTRSETEESKKEVRRDAPAAELSAPQTMQADEPLAFAIKEVLPDMTVTIRTNVHPHQTKNSSISIVSPHWKNRSRTAEYERPADLDTYMTTRFTEFSSLSARDLGVNEDPQTAPAAVPALMRGFGEKIYDNYAPEIFKESLWDLREKLGTKFKTILIITDDPNLPWELMRPRRNARSDAGEFLGLEYVVGRLHAPGGKTVGDSQPQNSSVSGITVIAPTYQGAQTLPLVAKEVDFLKSLTTFDLMDGVRRSDGNFENLKLIFDKMPAHIIHFAGHGTSSTSKENISKSAIQLSDTMLNTDAWRGLLKRESPTRPFFFFNACEVGRAGNFSGFVDGFAPTVLEAGASGYIGALWSIGDKGAKDFAELFYGTMASELDLRGSVSMADLMRRAKRAYLINNDPTFLAYIFYGDPNLHLVSLKQPVKIK